MSQFFSRYSLRTGCLFLLVGLVLTEGGAGVCAEIPQSVVFLIQDIWGGIIGLSVDSSGEVTPPAWVRPILGNQLFPVFIDLQADAAGGYQLTSYGMIFPIGNAKLTSSLWSPIGEVTGFAVVPDGSGGWTATQNYLTPIGRPPQLVLPAFYQTIMSLKYDAPSQRLSVLCENGSVAVCSRTGYEWNTRLQLTEDQAVDFDSHDKEIVILTQKSRVYRVTSEKTELLSDTPDLGEGLVRDIKYSPFGLGGYLLDAFGVIHAWGGAPSVPTEPLTVDAAAAMAILIAKDIPRWYPSGWDTEIELTPAELNLDPNGIPKTLSLSIHTAENLAGFSAEIHYDPRLITIAPDKIAIGDWWEKNMREAQVAASVDTKKGMILLQGGGAFYPFQGASGGGELAKIAIAAEKNVPSVTTHVEISSFFFRDASPGNIYQAGQIINSTTIALRPSYPRLSPAWIIDDATTSFSTRITKPGEIIRADLLIEEGGRIAELTFGFRFPSAQLKFLGMIGGSVWRTEYPIQADFSLPSVVNRSGMALHQRIRSEGIGACRDDFGSAVIVYFAVTSRGEGAIDWESIQILDQNGHPLEFQLPRSKLLLQSR